MEKITAMRTAKELAFKAYLTGMQKATPVKIEEGEIREVFENWWSEYYVRGDHKDGFNSELFVMIDRSVYIKAE
jgi:hypothetical protein